jgi:hypothetical protein
MGGVIGAALSGTNLNITNCEYLDGVISFTKEPPFGQALIGGFAGALEMATVTNNGSRASRIRVNFNADGGTASEYTLQVGGFAGRSTGNVRSSYSVSPLEIEINSATTVASRQAIGGFAGLTNGTINECYSTGAINIFSIKNENAHYFVGSFVGVADSSNIFDSYASGNIMIDRIYEGGSGNTDASGFATGVSGSSQSLTRCFSTASVTVMSQREGGGSVGGLLGYRGSATNSVALNPHLTAILGASDGFFTPNIGRITAFSGSGPTVVNCYAVDTLRLLLQLHTSEGTTLVTDVTNVDSPFDFTLTTGGSQTESFGKGHPGTTREASLFTTAFWRSLGFLDSIWDNVTAVTQRGHPTLRNVGGPQ